MATLVTEAPPIGRKEDEEKNKRERKTPKKIEEFGR